VTPQARAEIQTLLRRLADGERAAIEPAFDVLWPLVRDFSARALRHDADGEDAAQQALAKLFEQAADFDAARDGVAWVLTIASYECKTIRRKRQRRREDGLEHAAAPAAIADTPETLVIEQDLEDAVRALLDGLREEDAQAIRAAMADARPAADATFRTRLQRALGRLRVAWRAKHGTQ
jgi:RNA polymerase sigma-70 factor (ECF subfamily)